MKNNPDFVKKRSRITAISDILEDIRQKIDKNCVMFLTLLEQSKAFDSVNHNIVSTNLRNLLDFSGTAVKLIVSHLTYRFQEFSDNNISSMKRCVL